MSTTKTNWDNPIVRDHPCRPPAITLTPEGLSHILDRHGPASTRIGKTRFPADWDDETVHSTVLDVATTPKGVPFWHQNDGKWVACGIRAGVSIHTVIAPSGRIITAYPRRGPGVTKHR